MLPFLLLSVVTIAGASLVLGDFGEADEETEDLEPTEPVKNASGSSPLDFVTLNEPEPPPSVMEVAQSDEDVDGDDDVIQVDPGPSGETGSVEFLSGEVQYFPEDDGDPIIQVDAGAGNDLISVKSGVADIMTGEGADTVDASGMEAGLIDAGPGDLVIGSDVAADPDAFYSEQKIGVSLTGDAEFRGGTANELVVAHGDGATVDGGGGDDVLLNFDGSSTLLGGTGDDVIDADAFDETYEQDTRHSRYESDGNADSVDGGDGNDRLFVGAGDTVSGGTGLDFIRAAFPLGQEADPVTVTDFGVEEDNLTLAIDGFSLSIDGDSDAFEDRVALLESDGDSHVFVDDELVAVLENTQGLSVTAVFIPENSDGGWSGLEIGFV